MKKILIFIDWYLPGYKAGGPIRSVANMVAHLAEKFQFYIVTMNTDYLESIPYPDIRSDDWNQLSDNEFVYYFSQEKLSKYSLKKLIKSTDFDIAYINGIYSLYFSILPVFYAKRIKNKKVIIASRGMLSQQSFEVKTLKKKVFVIVAKLLGLYKRTIIQVTSNTENKDIELLKIKQKKIAQIPNLPPTADKHDLKSIEKVSGKLKLVSIARIAPEKNTLFALECFLNFSFNGSIEFDMYGAVYQSDYWEKCLEVIKKLPSNIKVAHKGEIHNNLINDTLKNYHFGFLPSRGENFGHSILESLLAGRPVIISNTTPWKNLEQYNAGWDIDLRKPELFAEKINKALSMDNSTYHKMMKSALSYAINYSNLEETKSQYYRLFS